MEALQEDTLNKQGFNEAYSSRFATVYTNKKAGILVCSLQEEYVPIEFFKETFLTIGEIVKDGKYEKFIFDKRSLRTFHQPSMEWYFIHWKRDMLEYGLTKHRKILPDIGWFKKAVMIAKHQLVERYPENIIEQLDIKYCDSIDEAISI